MLGSAVDLAALSEELAAGENSFLTQGNGCINLSISSRFVFRRYASSH
jgi:hypothetical protein